MTMNDDRSDAGSAGRPRMTKRPKHLDPPAMPENPPVPEPKEGDQKSHDEGRDPTRYGDWVSKGIAIDF